MEMESDANNMIKAHDVESFQKNLGPLSEYKVIL